MSTCQPYTISCKIMSAYLERLEDFATEIIMDDNLEQEQRAILQHVLRTTKENQVRIMDLEDSMKQS